MLAELGAATVLFTLPLEESSGLAVAGDRVYTVEDSGGPSTVFVYDRSGRPVQELAVDADNVDWEDLAVDGEALYVADVGDNRARRDSVQVHRVPLTGGPTTTYDLRYEGGAVDAESLVVSGGTVAVVTKELLGAGLWAAPLEDGAVLTRRADVPVALATGASLSPDGRLLAVRDYGGVREFPLPQGLAAVLDGRAELGPGTRSALPATEQGEAVAYDGGPDAVLTSTEGAGGPVHRLQRSAAPERQVPLPADVPPALPGWVAGAGAAAALVLLGAVLALRRRR